MLAFFYGTNFDPTVAAFFLAKLTRTIPHTHVPPPPSSCKIAFVPIPIRADTDAFIGMPKKSATTEMDGRGSSSETWRTA
jgi:hypothetical protein